LDLLQSSAQVTLSQLHLVNQQWTNDSWSPSVSECYAAWRHRQSSSSNVCLAL